MNDKIVVCGDSWMSEYPRRYFPNRPIHFGEILANKLSKKTINLAQPGCGNKTIILQIETALKIRPDLIILNTTNPNRFEMLFDLYPQMEPPPYEILNIFHHRYHDLKEDLGVTNALPNLICNYNMDESYLRLLCQDIYEISDKKFDEEYEDKIQDMVRFVVGQRDWNWDTKQAKWMMYSALHKLELSKIPYILILDALEMNTDCDWLKEHNHILPWLETTKHYLNKVEEYKKYHDSSYTEPHYHTLEKDQYEIAEILYNHILNYNLN